MAAGLALTALSGPAAASASPDGAPRLTGAHACAGQPDFSCATLRVPIDHKGRVRGHLQLQVATSNNVRAPKGVLLFLAGGPGQAAVPFADRIAKTRLPELVDDYRFVLVDQRGTGEFGALNCPQLQAQVGSSDIAVPTPGAIAECAGLLGATAPLYSTDQTVADLEALRQALGVRKMSLNGVSYGAFVAERYALAHPTHVNRIVLDSVVPHFLTSAESLYLAGLRAQARVLRSACATPACGFDPAEDLASVVRQRSAADGVKLFDLLVNYEFVDPTYRNPNPAALPPGTGDVIGAIHAARNGSQDRLNTLLQLLASGGDPVASFSAGLHAATICADMRFPWGTAATPLALRPRVLAVTERVLPTSAVWPYTQAVAVGQGFIQTCLHWPAERPSSNTAARLPNVPVLILNGDHDLSTPLEWAQQEAKFIPNAKLVVVPGASHSIQNRETGHVGRDAVIAFL
jgi:pimeloyl-ACP methyl ester carboxylesterase